MDGKHHLLSLPREIRDQIWSAAYGNHNIIPFEGAYTPNLECIACQSDTKGASHPKNSISTSSSSPSSSSPGNTTTSIIPQQQAIESLLACKQIYDEAHSIYTRTLRIHISSYTALSWIHILHKSKSYLNNQVRHLSLYTHLDAGSRLEWFAELFSLASTFPNLQSIEVFSHMRSPLNYESLIDAVYLLGPLLHLPEQVRPAAERAVVESTSSSSSRSDGNNGKQEKEDNGRNVHHQQRQHQQPTHSVENEIEGVDIDHATATRYSPKEKDLPVYASRDANPNFVIHFGYVVSEILFDSPTLGAISTSDAWQEHEAVLRNCLTDSEFRTAAERRDFSGMTVTLLDIAREHEQTWLERLHRIRRSVDTNGHNQFNIDTDALGEVDGGGEWGVDPQANDMSDATSGNSSNF